MQLETSSPSTQPPAEGGLCYFLVCFRDLEFVAFLLASLLRPCDLFLIHCDKRAPDSLKRYVALVSQKYENVIAVESQDYSWAGYSHVAVTLAAINDALSTSARWSHFVCLSEQHLPLKSPQAIEAYLREHKTVAATTQTTRMLDEAQADIRNRFSANYRELPGVGCFAVALIERQADFFESIFHGSNWLALHRDHCIFLLEAERDGKFEPFKSIVHAEEMALPSVLSPLREDIQNFDVTLVAAPHLVENRGLEMTDDLFRWGISTGHLFIRKRTKTLSAFAEGFIKSNHFRGDVYEDRLLALSKADILRDSLVIALKGRLGDDCRIEWVDPSIKPFAVRFHLIIRAASIGANRSIRVMSENLSDYKICLVEDEPLQGPFLLPYVENGILYSTLRVKISDFFGMRELLPLHIEDAGFISPSSDRIVDEIVDLVEKFWRAALGVHAMSIKPCDPAVIATDSERQPDTMRATRVNRLAKLVAARTYLEVGVCFGDTFFEVDIPEKVAVDPKFRFDFASRQGPSTTFHPVPSDTYFANAPAGTFDIIYLDGLHTYDQTTRDFFNSLRLSHERTIWLLDDTVPNDKYSALPDQAMCYHLRSQEGNPDPSWMGDVYKTVFAVARLLPHFHFRTFEGHGQTVIWQSKQARSISEGVNLSEVGSMTFEMLETHKALLNVASDEAIYAAIEADLRV